MCLYKVFCRSHASIFHVESVYKGRLCSVYKAHQRKQERKRKERKGK